MPPNLIMLPREHRSDEPARDQKVASSMTWPVLATSLIVLLVAIASWPRRWLLSGCAIESLLIILGTSTGSHIFPSVPVWTLLSSLNLIYAVSSTSWLLYAVFTAGCWPLVFLTCLFQFDFAANIARKHLRLLLRDLHFTRDRIALFNLPALEIDTEVSGLVVTRGVTLSLSNLTLVAHGVEIGIKLADDIELAMHVDQVRVAFFRRIEVGDLYANIKGGKAEMTFAEVEKEDEDDDSFFNDTPLLRAATAGSEGIKDRPKLRDSLTRGSYTKDATAKTGLDDIRLLSPDNQTAERQYLDILTEIRTSSAIYQSRAQARKNGKQIGLNLDDEKDMRAAACAELHDFPSVSHPPQHSVKVTTLQNLNKPVVRRFLHRLPFLLRLLLSALGYFHPINIASINAAGSGQWLKELLQQELFKNAGEGNAQIRRIQRRMTVWLADARFCLQVIDANGLGQVPLSTNFDIVAYLRVADIMAYRTIPQTVALERVVRLGGADATITIPVFLLHHHEHLLPPLPTSDYEESLEEEVREADGLAKTMSAEQKLEQVKKDDVSINMSVHATLPATFDQSLLMFVAALVKATKIIEFDQEVGVLAPGTSDSLETPDPEVESMETLSRASRTMTRDCAQNRRSEDMYRHGRFADSTDSIKSLHKRVQSDLAGSNTGGRLKALTRSLQQNLREASVSTAEAFTKESMTGFVRDMQQSTKGVKRAVVGGIVNDRWIAKLVSKVAANLGRAQGDLGYSFAIPVPLGPYRSGIGDIDYASKLMP